MKKSLQTIRLLFKNKWLYACMGLLFFIACDDDKESSGASYDPGKPVVVSSFRPLEGGVRQKVLLDGSNFGSDVSNIKVYFNHARAAVVSSKGNRIYALVPRLPGNNCTVSVVVGEDSVAYEQKFTYHTTASVSTITGNGSQTFQAGTLAQGQVYARYLAVDAQNNIFASVRDNGTYALVRINESENIVTPLIQNSTTATLNPNAPAIDLETGVVTVPHDNVKDAYYTFDPREVWAPRQRKMNYTAEDLTKITVNYKYTMAFCPYDGHVYSRYGDGTISKMDPETQEASIVYKTNSGAGYGLAFHPLKPYLLYFTFHSNVSGYEHSICTLDVRDPSAPGAFKKVSTPLTGAGHKDGPLEAAQFNLPRQLFFDPSGNLFVADYGNHCIRMISPDDMVETIVGQPGVSGWKDGVSSEALFTNPWGLAVGIDGTVYISDYGNARIRKLTIE